MASLLLLVTLFLVAVGIEGAHNVTIYVLETAISRGAVCLDGTPPAYAYIPGFGEGVDNWHVFLVGGAWCGTTGGCLDRSRRYIGSSAVLISVTNGTDSFNGMLDNNSTLNPDFYNWHVFKIFYCDGSSFMSDIEDVDPKDNLTYRGLRIYDAIRQTSDEKKAYFAQRQESARKDVERTFGVLQSRWAAIKGPTRLWDVGCVSQIMYGCIILHNMIVEDEGVQLTSWVSDDEAGPSHGTTTPSVRHGVPLDKAGRLQEFANMRQVDAHIQLQKDIIEVLWARRIARR